MVWAALSPAWQACIAEAWTACVAGSIPIGAVVSDITDGQILARGRNRVNETTLEEGARALFDNKLAHAELNALYGLRADGDARRNRCAIYTTTEPCPLCMGAIYMAGVRQVYYASRDPYAGSVNLLGATPYLSQKPVRASGPLPVIETIITAWYVAYHRRIYGPADSIVLDAWQPVNPQALALGERIHASGWLEAQRQANASPADVVEALAFSIQNGEVSQ